MNIEYRMLNLKTGENRHIQIYAIVDARLGVHAINAGFIWKAKGKSEGLRELVGRMTLNWRLEIGWY